MNAAADVARLRASLSKLRAGMASDAGTLATVAAGLATAVQSLTATVQAVAALQQARVRAGAAPVGGSLGINVVRDVSVTFDTPLSAGDVTYRIVPSVTGDAALVSSIEVQGVWGRTETGCKVRVRNRGLAVIVPTDAVVHVVAIPSP